MYVLIIVDDGFGITDVRTYSERADADHYVRQLAEEEWEVEENPEPPTTWGDCVALLAGVGEFVKLFHCPTLHASGEELDAPTYFDPPYPLEPAQES